MPIILGVGEQRQLDIALTPIAVEPARLFGYTTESTFDGPAIASASIHLFQDGIEAYNTISDVNGYYEINNIVPGQYDGLVQAAGYEDKTF